MKNLYVIDGCAFTEGTFTGVTEEVHNSLLDAFFLTMPGSHDGFLECVKKIGDIYNLCDDPAKRLMVIKKVDDLFEAKKQGKKGVIFTFQDPKPIENSIGNLRVLYELGLRVVQMTYNKQNYIGTGCVEDFDGGLTEFGRKVLKKMNEWGMTADISHVGHKTGMDVLRLSEKPIVISHAGCLGLTDSPRNKTDEELRLLRDNGGVIGLSSWGPLCWRKEKKARPTMADFVDHIDYVVNLIGPDHIAFGGDSTLDGTYDDKGTEEQSTLYPAVVAEYDKYVGTHHSVRHAIGIDGSWQMQNVIDELKNRGYDDETIAKFCGGNYIRVLKASWK